MKDRKENKDGKKKKNVVKHLDKTIPGLTAKEIEVAENWKARD